MLVSRKHAMLAGLHEKGLREFELLRQGKKLFDEEYEYPCCIKLQCPDMSQASTASPTNAQQEEGATPVEDFQQEDL